MPDRPVRPPVELSNFRGMFTKTNPDLLEADQLRDSVNSDYFSEYGSIRKMRGNKRVLTSPYTEGGVAKPISWAGFYKSQDFAGRLLRRTLIAAGTTIQRVKDDGTLEQIDNNQPNGLFHDHDQFDKFMFITSQDPRNTGVRGTPIKYDGFKASEWGITAPGLAETDIETFNDSSVFTTSNLTVSDTDEISWKGRSTKSVLAINQTSGYFERTGMTAFAIVNTIEDRSNLRLYIPEDQYRKLEGTGRAISVYFSSTGGFAGSDAWVRYDFLIGQLAAGWNTLTFDFSVFPSGDAGTSNNPGSFDDQNMIAVRFEALTDTAATVSSDALTLYWDNLVSLDAGSVTNITFTDSISTGAFRAGDGAVWSYKVTFVNEDGLESNAGPASINADLSGIAGVVETVLHSYDSLTNTTGTTDVGTVQLNTTDEQEGTGCVEWDKTGNTEIYAGVQLANQTINFSNLQNDQFSIDVYLPNSDRSKLASGAFEVILADSTTLENYHRFSVAKNAIKAGDWTTLTFTATNPTEEVGDLDLSSVAVVLVRFIFKSAAQTTSNFMKIDNLKGNIVNNYNTITLNDVPTSTKPGVYKRNIYRTVANGNQWQFVGTINDNTTVTFDDTVSDGALGTTQPPEEGEFFDSSPPPNAAMIKVWKRTIFMAGDPQNPNVLFFSQDDKPELFPLINAFEFDTPITGIYETRLGLVVTTETDHWRVIGDNPDYFVDRVLKGIGNVGFRACGESRMYGWAHDTDGLRLYDLVDTNKILEPIRNKIDELNADNLKDAWSVHSKAYNLFMSVYKNASGVYDTAYCYQYATDDVRTGWVWQVDFPSNLDLLCGVEVEDSNGKDRLYVGGNDGMLYEFMANDTDNWLNSLGSSTAMELKIETVPIRGGVLAAQFEGVTGSWKPANMEFRAREANGESHEWTVLVESLDGSGDSQVVRDSTTVTYTFPAGETLQRHPTPELKDLVGADYVKFTIKNNQLDKDVYFQGLRIDVDAKSKKTVKKGSTPAGRV